MNCTEVEYVRSVLDPVYTRAKVIGFIAKLERFSIPDSCCCLYTAHAATNPIVNLPCPETLNLETFVGTSYPETFETGENSRVNGLP